MNKSLVGLAITLAAAIMWLLTIQALTVILSAQALGVGGIELATNVAISLHYGGYLGIALGIVVTGQGLIEAVIPGTRSR